MRAFLHNQDPMQTSRLVGSGTGVHSCDLGGDQKGSRCAREPCTGQSVRPISTPKPSACRTRNGPPKTVRQGVGHEGYRVMDESEINKPEDAVRTMATDARRGATLTCAAYWPCRRCC
jgi:hypothetical protein